MSAYFVAEKAAGVPVFPPHGQPRGASLFASLKAEGRLGEGPWPVGFEGGIAHRLDTATSGAVLVASTPGDLAALREAFAAGVLSKTYRFVAAKDVPWNEHAIDLPVAHAARDRRKMIVQRGRETPHRGRWYSASTALRRVHGDVWEARITTGVMHQIRVHAAFVGLPLAGDALYGGGPGGFRLHHGAVDGPDGRWATSPWPEWAQGQ